MKHNNQSNKTEEEYEDINMLGRLASDKITESLDNKSNNYKKNTTRIVNKGTGAGGKNTNGNGKPFENKTDNEIILVNNGYDIYEIDNSVTGVYNYYRVKQEKNRRIVFVKQHGFKKYMYAEYTHLLYTTPDRCLYKEPDEAYIIEYNNGRKVVKILEKKNQNVSGSNGEKLLTSGAIIDSYKLRLGPEFEIEFAFCLSDYFKQQMKLNVPLYEDVCIDCKKHNVPIFFGDDDDYFEKVNAWINSS